MDHWRRVWREGIAPLLSVRCLEALRAGLATDDPAILVGATTTPPPMAVVCEWPVEAACPIGYCGWKGEGLETVAQVHEWFSEVCRYAGLRLGDQSVARWFTNHWDETEDRERARLDLLAEVNMALAGRRLPLVEDGLALDRAG